jgi:hypothetical protein
VSGVRIRGTDNTEDAASSIVAKAYLPRRCLAIVAYTFVAGMRLLSRCLAMGTHVTVLSSYLAMRIME